MLRGIFAAMEGHVPGRRRPTPVRRARQRRPADAGGSPPSTPRPSTTGWRRSSAVWCRTAPTSTSRAWAMPHRRSTPERVALEALRVLARADARVMPASGHSSNRWRKNRCGSSRNERHRPTTRHVVVADPSNAVGVELVRSPRPGRPSGPASAWRSRTERRRRRRRACSPTASVAHGTTTPTPARPARTARRRPSDCRST